MKPRNFLISVLIVLGFQLYLFQASAQNISQGHLPEGAIARLGKGRIYATQFSQDNTQLIVASGSGIWHYDVQTGEEIDLIRCTLQLFTTAAFSLDGRTLASGVGYTDGKVHLWDVGTGRSLKVLEGHTGWVHSVSFSPDGRTLASGGTDGKVHLWDVGTGRSLKVLEGHTGWVHSVSFSPDGRTLASGGRDGKVHLWDVGTGRSLKVLEGHMVHSVSFSPDGRTLASGGTTDGKVHLWDVGTGRSLKVLEGHTGGVYRVSFSPDGRTLASGGTDGKVHLWDVGTGRSLKVLEGHTGGVYRVSFSPDGRTLASGGTDGKVHLWDVGTGRSLKVLEGHTGGVRSVSFSPDGRTLASGGGDSTVRLWDVGTGRSLKVLEGHTDWVNSVSFNPDGRTLASGGRDGKVHLWDVGTGRSLKVLEGHTDWVNSVSFSPDGRTLASGGGDRDSTVRLWDVGTGRSLKVLEGHTGGVRSVSFSPDGRTLASVGGDSTVRLWDVGTGRSLKVLEGHTSWVNSVSFSPDGRTLASTSNDRTVRLWDVRAGDEHKQTYSVPCAVLSNPAFSPDGRSLAIGAAFNRVLLLDLTIGETWEVVSEDAESVKVVAFSPDGTTLVSVALTGVMFLWDVTRFTSQQQRPDLQQQQLQREHVRLVYFRPSDRAAQDAIDTRLHTLIKDTQHFYAAQMHRHDRKTFTFETDTHGKAVVHRVDGKFTDTYYQTDTYDRVRKEIGEQFNLSEHIYLVAIDVSSELVNDGGQGHICGIGGGSWHSSNNETWQRNAGGLAVIPASGRCFTVGVTAHELGHTFSLEHDFRDDANLMAYGSQSRLSEYTADWLSVHPYFNTTSKGVGPATMLAMRSNRLPRLQFHLTDSDGLHQAQLLIPTTAADPVGGLKLHDCQLLGGKTSSTVAFNVSGGVAGNSEVTLQVIDVRGNISKQTFSVKTDSVVAVSDVRTGTDVATVSLSPASVSPAGVGEHFVLNLMISGGVDVVGYQATVDFDTASLRYVSSANAEYLAGAFVIPTVVKNNRVTLAATALQGSSEGDGTLATLTFKVLTAHSGMPSVSDAKLTDSNADFLAVRIENSSVSEPVSLAGDVNGDGVLSVEDLSWAATRLGQRGENTADMNGDGVVDAADLLLIATAIDQGNAAPSLHSDSVAEMFTAAEVRRWLWLARQQGLTDPMYQRGFLLLEQLLVILTPKETALLSNYPNPFNPETWIPYHLSEPAEVRIAIYAADGRLVRTLGLEHQAAGIYESRSRAAYWDGRNALGEPVASGVYFYTLTAGDFAATRKMLIRK